MGKETNNSALQWVSLLLLIVLAVGSFTWMGAMVTVDEDAIASKVASQIDLNITVPAVEAYVNLTSIEDRLGDIETTINEDDDWEDQAIALATEEWEDRDYKDIFRWMKDNNYTIVDREDIDRVVVKDTDVVDVDADDEDAFVIQELKVYYEDYEGDDKKAYITVEITIEDGEVEDQDFDETD